VAADDLNAPLGQDKFGKERFLAGLLARLAPRGLPPIAWPQVAVGALSLFIAVFALWALLADNPLGGEPTAIVMVDSPRNPATPPAANPAAGPARYDGPEHAVTKPAANTQTVTIIDGMSGKRQEVVVPGSDVKKAALVDAKLLEVSRHGPIPKIAADGARPLDAYARKMPATTNADGPRVALIVGGLGVGASSTSDALAKIPGPVTFAFTPYGSDLENAVERARGGGHEILLQVPMEPFDYPDNDPGPQTLLSSLSGEQNVDRMQWLMSRFQGYVGVTNQMGARFTASEASLAPVLKETAKRGLIYVDDGSSARSLASQIAGANKVPFVKADVVIDSVPTAAEIDKALVRLETIARERGSATGYASALPVTIERVARWAKALSGRGVTLVPISAIVNKPKSS
jgi:polysaccharide deacetylase 2 family uncharacterized protein YibQ